MLLFVLYGMGAWILAAKWRRLWRGYFAVAASLVILLLAAAFYARLSRWSGGRIALPLMQILLYPYIALVFMGSLFLVAMPRTHTRRPGHCARCDYDLIGLEPTVRSLGTIGVSDASLIPAPAAVLCPECGHAHEPCTLISYEELDRRRELDLIRARSATRHQAPAPPSAAPPSAPSEAA